MISVLDKRAKERLWFPKDTSVALGLLEYICEPGSQYTLEDIVVQMGCNCVSAAGSLWQLRRAGYVERKRDSDRQPAERNARWGRNILRPTQRGRMSLAKFEQERKAFEKART